MSDIGFWLRWVTANAIGELLGLAPVALVGVVFARVLAEGGGTGAVLGAMLVFSVIGAAEGTVVGRAQWTVLRRRLPDMRRKSWVLATLAGAVAGWLFGTLPGVLASLFAAPSDLQFGDAREYLLAAASGLVHGAVLAFPQWRVLRRFVARSAWWLPANALAWGVTMPLVSLAAALPLPQEGLMPLLAAVLVTIVLAGVLLGAVHGAALVRLTR